MKRLVIPAASLPLLFLVGAGLSAQTRIALTGGVSLTSTEERFAGDNGSLFFSTAGEGSARQPSVGVSAIVPLPWSLSLEVGGAYSEFGRELALGWCGTAPQGGASVSMGYLEFKTLGRVDLPLAGNSVLAFVTVGPMVAWELSCRSTPTISQLLPDGTISWSPDGSGSRSCEGAVLELEELDFGLAGGVGLEVGVTGRLGFTVSTVYSRGMRDLDQVEDYFTELQTVSVRGGLVYRID